MTAFVKRKSKKTTLSKWVIFLSEKSKKAHSYKTIDV